MVCGRCMSTLSTTSDVGNLLKVSIMLLKKKKHFSWLNIIDNLEWCMNCVQRKQTEELSALVFRRWLFIINKLVMPEPTIKNSGCLMSLLVA